MFDFQFTEMSDSVTVIKLYGKLNEMTRSYFFQCLVDALDGTPKKIIVDCSGLGMLGSAGLASLMLARKQARKKGAKVFLTHVNSALAEALEHTRLNRLFSIYPSTKGLLELLRTSELAHS